MLDASVDVAQWKNARRLGFDTRSSQTKDLKNMVHAISLLRIQHLGKEHES